MFIQRYYLDCLSHASYMVADEKLKVAAIIDPQRDIDMYLADAKAQGFEIKHVILTHFHADFIAGHIELRNRVVKELSGAKAEAEFDFQPLGDGDSIELGDNVRLGALETPGHTPEGITILAFDKIKDNEHPYAAFTGDTLFIGDVGRPDLLASIGVTADELADMLYHSLHDKLAKLPMKRWSTPRTGPDRCAARRWERKPFPRSESNGGTTTRCSRCPRRRSSNWSQRISRKPPVTSSMTRS